MPFLAVKRLWPKTFKQQTVHFPGSNLYIKTSAQKYTFLFSCFLLFCETGSHHVALIVLEVTMYILLAFNSLQSAFLCFPTAGIPDVCHQAWQRHFSECCIYIIECICLRWKLMEDEKFTFKPYFFMLITISVKLAKLYFRFNSICRPLRRLTGQGKMTPPLPSPELRDWCKCYSREESNYPMQALQLWRERYPASWESRNTTKPNWKTKLTEEIYWEGKTQPLLWGESSKT